MLIEKRIDGTLVARDTMSSRIPSRAFDVSAGKHVVGARRVLINSNTGLTSYFVWPDTVVELAAGTSATRSLALYCS